MFRRQETPSRASTGQTLDHVTQQATSARISCLKREIAEFDRRTVEARRTGPPLMVSALEGHAARKREELNDLIQSLPRSVRCKIDS
ncbi:hypothetical protein CKO28_00980 [Rhodovibrio sodomensis]|uniref:Uncharacterized protein n=1 Tax=Rhodovibrio sodomensis TaxID=1088 RepID=A0ABS1D881_9PROT|nr:hypothetical protein [Rhodovibrio sodomensis]MBK1666616.1 hypothetical protein [Rhodovibrio sodomensis]